MRRCQDVPGVEDDPATPEASHDNPDHPGELALLGSGSANHPERVPRLLAAGLLI